MTLSPTARHIPPRVLARLQPASARRPRVRAQEPRTCGEELTCPQLASVDELLEWTPAKAKQDPAPGLNASGAPRCAGGDNGRPRVVHLHDMMGGYNMAADHYYRLGYGGWGIVDSFVYFAHSTVSVPPLSWIRDCHEHGVPILGTVLVETQGDEVSLEQNWPAVARNLVAIAQHYRFEGYLINVERSNMGAPAVLNNVLDALRRGNLTAVYYDSLDAAGQSGYQNELNLENKAYFDHASSILTNYWLESDLSLDKSLEVAGGARAADVTIGVDVFGRGTNYSAGQGITAILELVAARRNLSVGLFAPGWTYENFRQPTADNASWAAFERRFWEETVSRFTTRPVCSE